MTVYEEQLSLFPSDVGGDAIIQDQYRYQLARWWGPDPRVLLWILLNPSLADATHTDRTLEKCMQFTKREGYQRLQIVNIFAFRSTDPDNLRSTADPVGPHNKHYVLQAAAGADRIIIGWGNHATLRGQDREMLTWLAPYQLWCLRVTNAGHPWHPLYIPKNEPFQLFTP